jgi:transposase
MEEEDPRTQKRMQVILDHLAGRLNATQAAGELGISRKTFYQWLERAQTGMFQALKDRPTGRPVEPVDREKEQLQETVRTLEKEQAVLSARLRVQKAIRQVLEAKYPDKKKELWGS